MIRRAGPLAAVALALALAGCSGGEGDGDRADDGATTTASTRPAASLPGPPADPAVVGTWTADGEDQLAVLLADQGLDEVPACTGTVTLDLDDDGGFTRALSGTCAFATGDGEVEVVAEGGYATEDGRLVLTDVTGSGTLRGADGEELALPAGEAAAGGTTGYRRDGDDLVLTQAGVEVTFTPG